MTKLDELERLSKAATPGPWPVHQCRLVKFGATEINEDAKLIAAMRNNLDALIKVAKAAQKCSREGYLLPYPIEEALAELERGE